ncbi:MAG TPA: hypothetical protein VD861_16345, partial [Pyrinomonadaceae bacterium]|nr:hypothetical protein [Pyrinomonadaceae bacterium]
MDRPKTQLDRVFVRPQYALHYRRAPRIIWTSEARADYAALFLLAGRLPGSVGGAEFALTEDGAL